MEKIKKRNKKILRQKLNLKYTKSRNKEMHNSLFSHLTILYDASFVVASISRYFFLLHPHITTRQFLFFFFLLLYRFIFLFYTNYLGIVIFRFLCAWLSSISASRRLRFSPSTCNLQANYDPFIQIVEMINAKTFFS